MKYFLSLMLLSISLNALAQNEPVANITDNIVIDIPYLEVQTPTGKSAYSIGLQSVGADVNSPFFLQPDKFKPQALKTAAPIVTIQTNFGSMTFQLNAEKAPTTVANFLRYVEEDFYSGTIFHRVIGNFMIQGGGFDSEYTLKPPSHDPILNEAYNGLKNQRGSIAMARTSNPHSATSQFYINVVDNSGLDFPGHDSWGYTVFGELLAGEEVMDAIKAIPTGAIEPFSSDVPQTQVIIQSIRLDDAAE